MQITVLWLSFLLRLPSLLPVFHLFVLSCGLVLMSGDASVGKGEAFYGPHLFFRCLEKALRRDCHLRIW